MRPLTKDKRQSQFLLYTHCLYTWWWHCHYILHIAIHQGCIDVQGEKKGQPRNHLRFISCWCLWTTPIYYKTVDCHFTCTCPWLLPINSTLGSGEAFHGKLIFSRAYFDSFPGMFLNFLFSLLSFLFPCLFVSSSFKLRNCWGAVVYKLFRERRCLSVPYSDLFVRTHSEEL